MAFLLARLDRAGAEKPFGNVASWRRELRELLAQAGIHGRETRALLKIGMLMAPMALSAFAVAVGLTTGDEVKKIAGVAFVAFVAGLLLPRSILRVLASRRRQQIVHEVPVLARLIGLLFEAGLSLEGALRTLRDQAHGVLPALSMEVERALSRVSAGMDRAEALDQMARELNISELTDVVAVLIHSATTGGAVRQSLARMADVLEDRNRTRLRERVGRMSAQMTLVMMIFLFPALFIFLAGPGFIAIAGALSSMK